MLNNISGVGENDLVSIVIPAYNVEDFIGKCVESAINQEYRNIEILIADDGSKDKTGMLCDEYAKIDSRVRVLHKENGGLSDARNACLDVMTGKWVLFLDGDDYLDSRTVGTMLKYAKDYNADMVAYDWYLSAETFNGFYEDDDNFEKQIKVFDNGSIFSELVKNGTGKTVVTNKLYSANLWETVRFLKGKIHEDEFATNRILPQIKKAVITNIKLYYYRQRTNSIMGTGRNLKSLNDAIEALTERRTFFKPNSEEYVILTETVFSFYEKKYYLCDKIERKEIIKNYKKDLSAISSRLSRKRALIYWLFCINPKICRGVRRAYCRIKGVE